MSGDRHVVQESADGLLMAVVDAVGHGSEAADVATSAAESIDTSGGDSLVSTIQRCHRKLAGTRGAVAAIARIDAIGGLSWLAVGNVSAVVMRRRFGRLDVSMVASTHPGILGVRLPALRESSVLLQPGDLVLISTDGVEPGFTGEIGAGTGDLSSLTSHFVEERRIRSDDSLLLAARYLGSRDR
jgi:hypothetical protein